MDSAALATVATRARVSVDTVKFILSDVLFIIISDFFCLNIFENLIPELS